MRIGAAGRWTAAILLGSLLAAGGWIGLRTRGDSLELDRFPDWLEPCTPPRGVEGALLCGRYPVPEDRAAPAGRRIDLRVVVLASTGEPSRDAIVYLDGGPGAPATSAIGFVADLLRPLRSRRDLVFVDQRGTGGSHALECPELRADGTLQSYFDEMLPVDGVRACRDRLAAFADVRLYGSEQAADDLEDVRRALGYERLDLFGISYGTRAALVYLHRHPRSVRSAVLKGVAPFDMRNPLPFSSALDTTVRSVLDLCVADAACRAAFPDPHGDWARVRAAFENGPVRATVQHPSTGRAESVVLSRGVFADGLRHLLYDADGAAELPALLHAAAGGDFAPFAERELRQRIGFDDLLADGVFLTVTCAEDVLLATSEEIARATAGTFLGDYRVRRQLAACAEWPRARGFHETSYASSTAEAPVLLLSGALDPATPPDGGERAALRLPHARHVVVPGASHGFTPGSCEPSLIVRFFEAGSFDGIDFDCLGHTRLPPFRVDALPGR